MPPEEKRAPRVTGYGAGFVDAKSCRDGTAHSSGRQTPTAEQAAILALKPVPGKFALAQAIAGSGKTATLRRYAETHSSENILYLCFNKAQADEAQATFPPNAICRTTHSLAFREVGFRFTANPNKRLGLELRIKAVKSILRLVNTDTAHLVLRTITDFVQSAHAKLGFEHIPSSAGIITDKLRKEVLELAEQLWTRIIDPADTEIPISHDAYLKLWQLEILQRPKLPPVLTQFDVVLIDEAQDLNPTFESVIRRIIEEKQHTVLLVGDERQAIYGWRGAVNMMSRLRAEIRNGVVLGEIFALTESFRYGTRTAQLASEILAIGRSNENAPVQITGRGIDDPNTSGSHCYLARTNAALVEHALALTANGGGHIHFAATRAQDNWHPRIAYQFDFLSSVYGQYSGRRELITDPEVKRFQNWNEICAHVDPKQTGLLDLELVAAVKFVKRYGREVPEVLRQLGTNCGPPEGAIATVSTVHRAKGLEWDCVTLLEDFPPLSKSNAEASPDTEELNLLYVAVTRGRRWVNLNTDLEQFLIQNE